MMLAMASPGHDEQSQHILKEQLQATLDVTHSRAQHIEVGIASPERLFRLRIRDDSEGLRRIF
jgi:nitrate/nitrite-specific signal transduction histidine kinase